MPAEPVAAARSQAHTRTMGALFNRSVRLASLCALSLALALPVFADEIRLKDGKKLYGVIVAYEENMFKVKTDFGYVLVEKDKIESIIPDTPADETGSSAAAKPAAKSNPAAPGRAEANKQAKASAIVNSSAARPEIPLT